MKNATRSKLTPDEIRDGLINLGLKEEPRPIAGYAYTHFKHPDHAMSFYAETHGGAEATRFYIAQRMFILAH